MGAGVVYVLKESGAENVYKIGKTIVDSETRVSHLGTGNPRVLEIVHEIETRNVSKCEQYLHRTFGSKRVRGKKEWFTLEPSELDQGIKSVGVYDTQFLPKAEEAQRLAKEQSDGRSLPAGEREHAVWRRLVEVEEEIAKLDYERARLQTELKLLIGTHAGLDGVATWKSRTKPILDLPRFRRTEPDHYQRLFEQYPREVRDRPFNLL